MERTCMACERTLLIDNFSINPPHAGRAAHRRRTCNDCRREQKRARRLANPERVQREYDRVRDRTYGLAPGQYDAINAAQGGVCAICRRPCKAKSKGRLSVDHDHTTGVVRGLLCSNCNVGIGLFSESTSTLRAAALYIESR